MKIDQLSRKITVFIQYYTWVIFIRHKEGKNQSHLKMSKMYAVNNSIILSFTKISMALPILNSQQYL